MTAVPPIHGTCDPRFARVREAFAGNFREHGEIGAAVVLFVGGRPVVDLWGGWADGARTRGWERDTLVNVFSVGKAMVTLALLMAVDRGYVELDAPVAQWWPEFAAEGKGDVTVRTLLCHRAGLPAIARPLAAGAMYDWDLMAGALAAQAPWWPPGTQQGYHVNTFGYLVGEVFRRASGEGFAPFFAREVAGRLGADFHFGVGATEDRRIAEYVTGDIGSDTLAQVQPDADGSLSDHAVLLRRVYGNPPGVSGLGTVNTRAWRAAVIPSTNGHATARGVAACYVPLAAGGASLLSSSILREATAEASAEIDVVLSRPARFGLGFQLTQPERPLGPNPGAFGHFGAGGSLGFADPAAGVAFGYVMNRAGPRWQNPCNRALIDAVYASL